jgi:hypothetical protein
MTITFENESDVIIYSLEKIISFAREEHYFFVANCAWWIASIIGLESDLIIYIDRLATQIPIRQESTVLAIPRAIIRRALPKQQQPRNESPNYTPSVSQKPGRQERAVSSTPRDIARGVSPGKPVQNYNSDPLRRTRKGRIDPLPRNRKRLTEQQKEAVIKTAGINQAELQRRKENGECLRCAWPADRKGAHRVANCRRTIKLDKGTANFPKAKENQKIKQLFQQATVEEDSPEDTSSAESSNDSL